MSVAPHTLLPLLTAVLCAAACAAQVLAPERRREILHDALNSYDQALGTARADPRRSQALYRESAGAFEALVESGVRNAAIEFNLGNVYMRLGRIGRAILHYRRGLALEPAHQKLASNLAYARKRVEPIIVEAGGRRLLRGLLFWHFDTSTRRRLRAAGLLSSLGWLLLLLRIRRRRGPLLAAGVAAIVCGLLCSASVAWQLHDQARMPHAVVVEGGHVLRLGRGDGADPAMRRPLGPGVELRIVGERGGWAEVGLRDGRTGWLPASAIARIETSCASPRRDSEREAPASADTADVPRQREVGRGSEREARPRLAGDLAIG